MRHGNEQVHPVLGRGELPRIGEANGSSPDQVGCLLVGEQRTLLTLLARYLENEEAISVAISRTGREDLAQTFEDFSPSAVVLDMRLPSPDGLDAIRGLLDKHPGANIVLFVECRQPAIARDALELGVRAVVSKDAPPEDLARAIKTAADGRGFLDPLLGASLIPRVNDDGPLELTSRERDVLRLLASGMRNTEIGEQMSIASDTVRQYSGQAMRKLGAQTRIHAVAIALQRFQIALD